MDDKSKIQRKPQQVPHPAACCRLYTNGRFLSLLIYGVPVWAEAMRFEYNRTKYVTVQRLMSIKIKMHSVLHRLKHTVF